MFDIGWSELFIIGVVALLVLGPEELPRAMRTVGQWVSKARGMARHFQAGVDEMMRQAELEDLQKQLRETQAALRKDAEAARRDISGAFEDRPKPPPPSAAVAGTPEPFDGFGKPTPP